MTLSDDSYTVGVEVLPGSCPETAPDGLWYAHGWEAEPDAFEFYPEAQSGPNCALFTALDESYYFYSPPVHGPVVMREFQVSG